VSFLRSILMALALFTRIPLPTLDWKQRNMRHTLAVMPFIGLIIGLVLWLWLLLSEALGLGTLLFAAGLTLLPVLVTGGIHLDGFCDTVDALSSRAPMERKREILKDPHIGTFAVIGIVVYLLAYCALCTELAQSLQTVLLLGCVAVLSRSAGALACLVFSLAPDSKLLRSLREAAGKLAVPICALWCLLAIALACFVDWHSAVTVFGVILLVVLYMRFVSKWKFGGMSGDLAGYLIQLAELGAVIALVLVEKVTL